MGKSLNNFEYNFAAKLDTFAKEREKRIKKTPVVFG
jgi:hypothetical protein